MPDLKLSKLPDRTPVKLSIQISPDLDRQLQAYAGAYKETYGDDEKVVDLVPFMLQKFLDGDRKFLQRARTERKGKRGSGRANTREQGG
jgi:hypothetical protein